MGRARVIATILEGLNARRQLLTTQVFQGALAQVEKDAGLLDEPVLVLAHPAWPAGVIGIVASHLVERFNRPVVLLANPPGTLARGSARSVEGCDITAAIATQKSLLSSFGGHPMAAGLAMDAQLIPDFRKGFSQAVRSMVGELHPEADLQVDGYLPLDDLSLELVEDFRRLAPFGPGNPSLVLAAKDLTILSSTPIGRNKEHLQVTVQNAQGHSHQVLWWQGADWDLPDGRFDLAFTVQASDFRGVREVQIEWVDTRVVEKSRPIQIQARKVEVVDDRQKPFPLAVLKELAARPGIQVWCEADAFRRLKELGISGRRREMLEAGRELAIWTTPPGRKELKAALERVSPEVVYLFCVDPGAVDKNSFLKRLAGVVKYALKNNQDIVELAGLASATGQSEITVRKGLDWLAGKGYLAFKEEENGKIKLSPGGKSSTPDPQINDQLDALLKETSAFREYFHEVEKILIKEF